MSKRSWRWRRTVAAAGAIAVLATVGLAGPARADDRLIDTDQIHINETGFDFGTGTYNNIELSDTAPVRWLVDDNNVTPEVTGILHLAGVNGVCARMRIDYYSAAGVQVTERFGGRVCAEDNGRKRFAVDLAPYTSDKIGKVKVSIEVQLADLSYSIVGSDWSTRSTYIDNTVEVSAGDGWGIPGIGFGGAGWNGAVPIGGGQITWSMFEGQIRPHLTGTLHLESAAGSCVRMRIDYYEDDGIDSGTASDLVTTVYGGTVCVLDNAHERFSVDRDDYADSTIRHVRVSIEEQTSANTWAVIDSTYSYFGLFVP